MPCRALQMLWRGKGTHVWGTVSHVHVLLGVMPPPPTPHQGTLSHHILALVPAVLFPPPGPAAAPFPDVGIEGGEAFPPGPKERSSIPMAFDADQPQVRAQPGLAKTMACSLLGTVHTQACAAYCKDRRVERVEEEGHKQHSLFGLPCVRSCAPEHGGWATSSCAHTCAHICGLLPLSQTCVHVQKGLTCPPPSQALGRRSGGASASPYSSFLSHPSLFAAPQRLPRWDPGAPLLASPGLAARMICSKTRPAQIMGRCGGSPQA